LATWGGQVLTSYIDSSGTRQERRNELVKRYKFVCDCPACQPDSDNEEVDPREALKCPKCTNWFSIGRKHQHTYYHILCSGVVAVTNSLTFKIASYVLYIAKRANAPDPGSNSSQAFELSSPGSSRLDAGPSSSSRRAARKEITCPHCGFSRLIDVEGQRSAIKKSGKALDPAKGK
jgi:SET and MYND domain-containing protein